MNKDKLTPQEIFQKSSLGKSITPEERAILRKTLATPYTDSISGNERIKDKNENKARMGSKLASSLGGYVPKIEIQKAKSGIYIKPENRGKFTKSANRAGMGVQEFAKHVLGNKEDYSSTQVKRANFARNFGGRKQTGGTVEEENQQRFFQKGGYTPTYKTRNGKQPEIPIKRKTIKHPKLMKDGSYINESDIITNLKVGGSCHKCGGNVNMQTGGKACGCRHKQKGGDVEVQFKNKQEARYPYVEGRSEYGDQMFDIVSKLDREKEADANQYNVQQPSNYSIYDNRNYLPAGMDEELLFNRIDNTINSYNQDIKLNPTLYKDYTRKSRSLEKDIDQYVDNLRSKKQSGGIINESDVLPIAQNESSLPCHKCGGAHKPYQMCYGGNVEEFKVIDEQDVLPLNDSNRFATRTSSKPVGFMYSKTITQ